MIFFACAAGSPSLETQPEVRHRALRRRRDDRAPPRIAAAATADPPAFRLRLRHLGPDAGRLRRADALRAVVPAAGHRQVLLARHGPGLAPALDAAHAGHG